MRIRCLTLSTLVLLAMGGRASGDPIVSPGEPTVTRSEPTATPGEPTVTRSEPTATPGEPTVTRSEPAATPGEPAATPSGPIAREGDGLRHFALNANPLGLLVGRYSLDLQVIPLLHHAIVVTPFYQYVNANLPIFARNEGTQTAYGGELGYHYYTGLRGPDGFFVGGGGILEHSRIVNPGSPIDEQDIAGFFADMGVQGVTASGFMAGVGVGYQVTKRLVQGAGWGSDPRGLLMVGYAF